MNRMPFGVVGAERALVIASRRLTGEYAEVRAAFDPDEKRLRALEPELEARGICCFRDFMKFAGCGIGAMIISGGELDRAQYAIKALRRGVHVLSEPPMALTLDDVSRIERASRESGKYYALAVYSCHRREVLLAKELFRRGDIGRLVYAEGSSFVKFSDRAAGIPSTFNCAGSVGQALITCGQRAVRVSGFESRSSSASLGVELLELSNGALCRAANGSLLSPREHGLRLIGETGSLEIIGGGVLLTDGTGKTRRNVFSRPEGFLLDGMCRGGSFEESSAIAGFAAKLLGDSAAAARCIDVYRAADISLPGMIAHRSIIDGGRPLPVPDLRSDEGRDACRGDRFGFAVADEKYRLPVSLKN